MRIGIDLGGTKIEAIALDHTGKEKIRIRKKTPVGDYQQTLAGILALVEEIESQFGVTASVGIGTPGSLSPADSGVMRNANSTCLNGEKLDRDLAEILKRPIKIANDADCFALSEATDGAGKNAHTVFAVILGTGVGGGIVVNGKLLSGPNRIAGEWGHNGLARPTADELPGRDCYCGRKGCIETFLSGPAFECDYFTHSGEQLASQAIVKLAQNGQGLANENLARYQDRLARCLAGVINIIDPDVVVLGGGMSNIKSLYQEVPQIWHQYIFSDIIKTRLLPPVHGDSSGVRGAAWLWSENNQP